MKPISPDTSSLAADRTLRSSRAALATSLQRVTSGLRLRADADDPRATAATEKLRNVLRRLDAESRSLERADQTVATADAALGEVFSLLERAEDLIANKVDDSRKQIDEIIAAADRVASSASFDGTPLLDGGASISAGGDTVRLDRLDLTAARPDAAANTRLTTADARTQVTTLRSRLAAFSRDSIGTGLQRLSAALDESNPPSARVEDTGAGLAVAADARATLLADPQTAAGMSDASRATVLDLLG